MNMNVTWEETDRSAGRPQFDYDVLVCRDYAAVLRGDGDPAPAADLIAQAFDVGRVLIQAKGGSGKTTILRRLANAASEIGIAVSKIDALTWAASFENSRSKHVAAQSLFSLSSPPVSEGGLRASERRLLLVDGLNEIAPTSGALLIDEVDDLASQFPSVAIILTDRLRRRNISSKLWILTTLSPVPEDQIIALLGEQAAPEVTLRLPYYLNLALKGDRGTRSESHKTYLLEHGGVDEGWLADLAAGAYAQYRINGDRSVDADDLASYIGENAFESIVAAGTLHLQPTCRFDHHLVHDYLAATHAATRPDLWDSEGLDVLTFKATSMDALALILEQAPKNADLLLQHVYDWNFYGAASLIAEDRENGSHISAAMELAVVTMLGERRFDRFSGTAQQVSDALQVIDSEIARAMTAASSRDEIINYVQQARSRYSEPAWLDAWIALYTRPDSEPSTLSDVQAVASDDSVVGWTMSNVLRRSPIEGDVEQGLAKLALAAKSPAVRWRAVHALGADPTHKAVDVLFKSIDEDDSTWVQYGSIRSLVEIALVSEDLRQPALDGLTERVALIRKNASLAKELERVLLPAVAPKDWADDSSLLVETLWAKAQSVGEQDRWRKLGASIRALPNKS